jgi:hypothetical protein
VVWCGEVRERRSTVSAGNGRGVAGCRVKGAEAEDVMARQGKTGQDRVSPGGLRDYFEMERLGREYVERWEMSLPRGGGTEARG